MPDSKAKGKDKTLTDNAREMVKGPEKAKGKEPTSSVLGRPVHYAPARTAMPTADAPPANTQTAKVPDGMARDEAKRELRIWQTAEKRQAEPWQMGVDGTVPRQIPI